MAEQIQPEKSPVLMPTSGDLWVTMRTLKCCLSVGIAMVVVMATLIAGIFGRYAYSERREAKIVSAKAVAIVHGFQDGKVPQLDKDAPEQTRVLARELAQAALPGAFDVKYVSRYPSLDLQDYLVTVSFSDGEKVGMLFRNPHPPAFFQTFSGLALHMLEWDSTQKTKGATSEKALTPPRQIDAVLSQQTAISHRAPGESR